MEQPSWARSTGPRDGSVPLLHMRSLYSRRGRINCQDPNTLRNAQASKQRVIATLHRWICGEVKKIKKWCGQSEWVAPWVRHNNPSTMGLWSTSLSG